MENLLSNQTALQPINKIIAYYAYEETYYTKFLEDLNTFPELHCYSFNLIGAVICNNDYNIRSEE